MTVAHPHVALDVQRRAAGEAERLHVRKDLRLVEAGVCPGAPKAAYELLVQRAAIAVDQLDLLATAVVCIAVANDHVEAVYISR